LCAFSEKNEPNPAEEITRIEPPKRFLSLNLSDFWRYSDLLYFLIWREIKVRYKQTVLGVAWAVIQPVFAMLIFTLFFGRLAKISSDGVPYPIFTFCALIPWQLFANTLNNAGNSLVSNQSLIQKIYFPRLMIPVSSALSGLVDFSIAFVLLLLMMVYYSVTPTWNLVYLPLFILLLIATVLAMGLWLSSLNVRYRDVRYAIPFLTQFWLFATPVVYPTSMVPEKWRILMGLNPMAGVVEGFRWALLGAPAPHIPMLLASLVCVGFLLVAGLVYFRRMEHSFADVI
jgi:lipopolysaccharide transport system permease protein